MKALGIIRRVDDLGRLVIPKELRNIFGLAEGTPVEFYVEDEKIIIQKYAPNKISDKIDELINLIYDKIEDVGLEECVALENELKEIAQMFDK